MWAALEAHKPDASYAKAWATMCKERTRVAASVAWCAAPVGSAAWVAALLALMAADAAEEAALRVERYAQDAIDAIKEVKP
jgi:hypothetical protein